MKQLLRHISFGFIWDEVPYETKWACFPNCPEFDFSFILYLSAFHFEVIPAFLGCWWFSLFQKPVLSFHSFRGEGSTHPCAQAALWPRAALWPHLRDLEKQRGVLFVQRQNYPFSFLKRFFQHRFSLPLVFFASLIAFNISGTIQYVVFCSWLLLLSVSSSRNQ